MRPPSISGTLRLFALVIGLLPILTGCNPLGPRYTYDAPKQFKAYDAVGIRMITPDGVKLKVREVENYPKKADLSFWTEAVVRHLESNGYTKVRETTFSTRKGTPGVTLEFVVPRGPEDWVFSETIFVVEKRIVLVEAAGPFALFEPLAEDLRASYATFDPGPAWKE